MFIFMQIQKISVSVKVFQDILNVCGVFVSEYVLEFNDAYNAASPFIQKDTVTTDFIVLYCDIH